MRIKTQKKAAFSPLVMVLVLVLTACSGGGSGGATTVTVTLTDFAIQASQTTFQVGTSYHFVVTNKGSVAHQFVIMTPMPDDPPAAQVKSAMLAGIDDTGLAAGASQSFDYTFKTAAPAGTLEFACHLQGHYDAGMHSAITVQ